MFTLATRALPQLLDVHAQPSLGCVTWPRTETQEDVHPFMTTSSREWRRQWTVCSFTRTLDSSVPHSISMRFLGQLPLMRTRPSVWRRENSPGSYWTCRTDTSCPLGTGDSDPPVASVQDRRQGRGEVHPMITIFAEYYTLQLENTGFTLGSILRKFDWRFESSAPDLTHQLNFQSAVQGSGESLRQWSDQVLTWLSGPSLSSLTCMPRPFPDCFTGPKTRMRGCTPLMVIPRQWRRR